LSTDAWIGIVFLQVIDEESFRYIPEKSLMLIIF